MHFRAGVVAWNDGQLLPRCLLSLVPHCDTVTVVDGVFAGFPHSAVASTDDTAVVAVAHGATFVAAPTSAWRSEATKRNAYLVGDVGDWVVVLDADEELVGGAALRRILASTDADWCYVMHRRTDPEHWGEMWLPRVFRLAAGLRYECVPGLPGGWSMVDGGGAAYATLDERHAPLGRRTVRLARDEIEILHYRHLRPRARLCAQAEYFDDSWTRRGTSPCA